MREKLMNKAGEAIQAIAEKLGVAAEHVYGILVRQQVASGIVDLLIWVVMFAILAVLGWICWKAWADLMKHPTKDEEPIFVLSFFSIVYGVIVVIAFFFMVPESIKMLINPEYYALKEIMNMIEGMGD